MRANVQTLSTGRTQASGHFAGTRHCRCHQL